MQGNTLAEKVLVSPSSFGQCGLEPIELLKERGYQIIMNPYGRKLAENEVIELAKDCVGIVAGVEPLTARVLAELKQLRCISRVGVGMDSIDHTYAEINGIQVVNTPDGPTRAVAEMSIALMFSLIRKIPQADSNIRKGIWKKEIGNYLFNKTIGIIGLGRIGKLVAEMYSMLGNQVIGFDLKPNKQWAKQKSVQLADMNDLLSLSDIVSLHVPANKEKSAIIGAAELSKMKSHSFLINASRGGVVDETALYKELRDGRLAGAAVDVFDHEPYQGPLTKLNNTILTPHLGSYAAEGKLQMEIQAVNNLLLNL
jgi:D-3-phosphoglycerate dehydrogenase / 2-oxoglutarate reductase